MHLKSLNGIDNKGYLPPCKSGTLNVFSCTFLWQLSLAATLWVRILVFHWIFKTSFVRTDKTASKVISLVMCKLAFSFSSFLSTTSKCEESWSLPEIAGHCKLFKSMQFSTFHFHFSISLFDLISRFHFHLYFARQCALLVDYKPFTSMRFHFMEFDMKLWSRSCEGYDSMIVVENWRRRSTSIQSKWYCCMEFYLKLLLWGIV